MICDRCNGIIIFIETPESVHYGKEVCSKCNKWFRWITQPNPEGIRKKVSKHNLDQIKIFHNFKKVFCFLCLREKKDLGFNETLTRDHIEEIDKGGKDEVQNLQILCSACHKLKNWARLYMNWHLKK